MYRALTRIRAGCPFPADESKLDISGSALFPSLCTPLGASEPLDLTASRGGATVTSDSGSDSQEEGDEEHVPIQTGMAAFLSRARQLASNQEPPKTTQVKQQEPSADETREQSPNASQGAQRNHRHTPLLAVYCNILLTIIDKIFQQKVD
jgi:hypothetical protein